MAREQRRHLFIAGELASSRLLEALSDSCLGLRIQSNRLCPACCDGEKHFRRLVLILVGQLADLGDRLFEQLGHALSVAHLPATAARAPSDALLPAFWGSATICVFGERDVGHYARSHLSELIERVSKGETVQITRRGKPVAQLAGIGNPKKPIDVELLRALTRGCRMQTESTGDFIRRMRDDSRY